jgi:hypothetical protein
VLLCCAGNCAGQSYDAFVDVDIDCRIAQVVRGGEIKTSLDPEPAVVDAGTDRAARFLASRLYLSLSRSYSSRVGARLCLCYDGVVATVALAFALALAIALAFLLLYSLVVATRYQH